MRSLLFAPAHRTSMVRRALSGTTGADRIIVDLEDGVPNADRPAAAATLRELDTPDTTGPPAICRVRGALEGGLADLDLIGDRFDGIMLAKAEHLEHVVTVSEWAERQRRPVDIWLLIETARGLLKLDEMLSVGPVCGVMFGAADMQADLRIDGDSRQLDAARSRIIFSCVAAGVRHVVDTPEAQLNPNQEFYESSRSARGLGFTAKAAIHPAQVPAIHEIFGPAPADIARAAHLLTMPDGATSDGITMVDDATKRWARGVLASANNYERNNNGSRNL